MNVRRVLLSIWWPLLPSFAALSVRLAAERTCANPYDLLPGLTSNPSSAWLIACVYVAAHVWMAAAYLVTALAADTLLPRAAACAAVWESQVWKLILMGAVFVIEYMPMPVWRVLGSALHCRP